MVSLTEIQFLRVTTVVAVDADSLIFIASVAIIGGRWARRRTLLHRRSKDMPTVSALNEGASVVTKLLLAGGAFFHTHLDNSGAKQPRQINRPSIDDGEGNGKPYSGANGDHHGKNTDHRPKLGIVGTMPQP